MLKTSLKGLVCFPLRRDVKYVFIYNLTKFREDNVCFITSNYFNDIYIFNWKRIDFFQYLI